MTEEIKRINGLSGGWTPSRPSEAPAADKPQFSEVISGLIRDVDNLQKQADFKTDKLVTGELENVHEVVVAMEEAQTSFRLLMEIRNKMVDAYKEVMKMQV